MADGTSRGRKIVEQVIRALGLDPEAVRIPGSGGGVAYRLIRGSAELMVAVNPGPEGRPGRLRIVAPVVKLKYETPPAQLQRLLEINGTVLPGIAFGIIGDKVALVAERTLAGLDRSEVEDLLATVGHYADEYDDLLVRDFGGTRVCDLD